MYQDVGNTRVVGTSPYSKDCWYCRPGCRTDMFLLVVIVSPRQNQQWFPALSYSTGYRDRIHVHSNTGLVGFGDTVDTIKEQSGARYYGKPIIHLCPRTQSILQPSAGLTFGHIWSVYASIQIVSMLVQTESVLDHYYSNGFIFIFLAFLTVGVLLCTNIYKYKVIKRKSEMQFNQFFS